MHFFTNQFVLVSSVLCCSFLISTVDCENGDLASRLIGFRSVEREGFDSDVFSVNCSTALESNGISDVGVTSVMMSNTPNVNYTGIVVAVEFNVYNATLVNDIIQNQQLIVEYGIPQTNNTNNTNNTMNSFDENDEGITKFEAYFAYTTSMFVNAGFDDIPEDRVVEFYSALRGGLETIGVNATDVISTPVVGTTWPMVVQLTYIGYNNHDLITQQLETGIELPFQLANDELRLVATSNRPVTTIATTTKVVTTTAGFKPNPDVLFKDDGYDLTPVKLVVAGGFAVLVSTFLFGVLVASQVRNHCFKSKRQDHVYRTGNDSGFADLMATPDRVRSRNRSYGTGGRNSERADLVSEKDYIKLVDHSPASTTQRTPTDYSYHNGGRGVERTLQLSYPDTDNIGVVEENDYVTLDDNFKLV